MEIKITTPKQVATLPEDAIEKALRQAADEALIRAMAQNWDRQRFWYWLPPIQPRFKMRPSISFEAGRSEDE